MANNQILKDAIANVIKTNGNNEITGQLMQNTLLSIINHFGSGAIFLGVAQPNTVPLNNDVVGFYIANVNGVYVNFDSYNLQNNDLVIFTNKTGSYKMEFELKIKSIVSNEKTSTVGNVDTYTITYTDGSTTIWTVTNGIDGLSRDEVIEIVNEEILPLKNKIDSIVELQEVVIDPVTHKDVPENALNYGAGTGITGWGFPSYARKNITQINIKIVSVLGSVTQFLRIKENDKFGSVLHTQYFSENIIGNSIGAIINFELDEIVENINNTKLWIEIYGNNPIGIYRINPAVLFTTANGFPFPRTTTATDLGVTEVSAGGLTAVYDVYHEIVTVTVEDKYLFTENAKDQIIEISGSSNVLPNENTRTSYCGDSVPWGDGFLQSGFVAEIIKERQTNLATSILASEFNIGVIENNRKHFLGKALRLTGIDQEINFTLKGNEVSIVQSKDRVNTNASEIEIYIDDVLYDTFNNFNRSPIGTIDKNFTGNGSAVMFDLNTAFTYGHVVTVNGVNKVVVQNTNTSVGFVIPANADCAIIRKQGIDSSGNIAVTHWIWFKVAPLVSDSINVKANNGEKITYEKTTIGETSTGVIECPYGDGDISFDPTAPSSIGAGLDFRQTNEDAVIIYRFLEDKQRNIKLKIKGLYPGASGTPYFLFNFATNRFFYFQNAGIGGFKLSDLNKSLQNQYLRNWQRIVSFNPDNVVLSICNNDDWEVRGYKIYTQKEVSLSELRNIKTLPLREILYLSASGTYNISKWVGEITEMNDYSVTFSGTLATPIEIGDNIRIGNYWSNNSDYISRIVLSINGNTLFFDKPISKGEIIYNSFSDFVGKEICVRNLSVFNNSMVELIDKIRQSTDCNISILENPMPNVLARDLWCYPYVMKKVSGLKNKVFTVDYYSLRKWQNSQPKTKVDLNISSAVIDNFLGKRVIEFGAIRQNTLATDIKLNGVSIYGKRAVVQNGWGYTVNQSATGTALNKGAGSQVNTGQVFDAKKPRVVILDDTLTSGVITVEYSSVLWSNDSCHMNANSSILYKDFLSKI